MGKSIANNTAFTEALQAEAAAGRIPVIPDIKCYSPKEGDLMRGRDPVQLAMQLEAAGAPALSVVTEGKEFQGSMELLRAVCDAVKVPVLRKDFITSREDLVETREAGAAAILLMVSCLGEEKLTELYHEALTLGLLPFVETHTEAELAFAAALGAKLIGINNRDITVLERDDGDVSHAVGLMDKAPEGAFVVVESSLKDGEEARRAVNHGAGAVLVGTAILSAADPVRMFRSMRRRTGLKICGLTDAEGVRLCAAHHVDIMGFVTEYPEPVPWNLDRERAAALLAEASGKAQTCIVTGGSPDKVIGLATELIPDLVQLHHREMLPETAVIAKALRERGIRVIRSIPSDPAQREELFGVSDMQDIYRRLENCGVWGVLPDARHAGNAAERSKSMLDLWKEESLELPPGSNLKLLVGGGITQANARQVIGHCRPDYIDVMTGVETQPGIKSEALLEKLEAEM